MNDEIDLNDVNNITLRYVKATKPVKNFKTLILKSLRYFGLLPKDPTKARYLITPPNYSVKQLSKAITEILKLI